MSDNITLPREVVKLALEALEWSWGGEPMGTLEREAITALRTALAAPKEEPVDVGSLEYRGNSVAYIYQKMTCYKDDIRAVWSALKANGIRPDGNTPLEELIAKHTALAAEPTKQKFDHSIGAERFKVVRGTFWWHVKIGDSPTEHGKFRSSEAAQKMADDLLREFRNGAFVQNALAAETPKPEPVAWMDRFGFVFRGKGPHETFTTPLYTAPPEDEALRRDAERYRWLRNRACHGPHERFVSEYGWFDVSGQHEPGFDAAIDAAMGDKR